MRPRAARGAGGCWLGCSPRPARAAAACPKTSLADLEDEVMCLQCGVPLNVAEDAPSAKRERAFIQQLVDQCQSKQQIKDQLVAQFGDRILAEPEATRATLARARARASPPALIARRARRAGGGAAARRRRQRPPPPRARRSAPPTPPASTPTSTATTCDPVLADTGTTRPSSRPSRSASSRSSRRACCRSCRATCRPSRASRSPSCARASGRAQVLGPALIFCISFTVMFVALGMGATGIGQLARRAPRHAAPHLGHRDRRDGRAVHRHDVRPAAEPRVAPRRAHAPRAAPAAP